jgi:hypothetical protein
MKRAAGQVGRTLGWVVHHTGMIFITVFFVFALVVGNFAFRLSQGPVQVPWLASRLANVVSGRSIDIHISDAALAWGGYRGGGAVPVFLRLRGITARNAAGQVLVTIRSGKLVFLPGALVGGQAPILVTSTDAVFQGSDVTVAMQAAIQLNGFLKFSRAVIAVRLGAGSLGAAGVAEPIVSGAFDLAVAPGQVALSDGELRLAKRGTSAPVVGFSGTAWLDQQWHGRLALTADSLAADDLAAYWPAPVLTQTRDWVTQNISAGTASDATFVIGLTAPKNLASVKLAAASGRFSAAGVSVGWIPHARLITGVGGVFELVDDDDILLTAAGGALGGVAIGAGQMKISGLMSRTQVGTFSFPVQGRLQDVLAVLNEAPLNLLRTAPAGLLQATGQVTGNVAASLPLRGDVRVDQVDLTAAAAVENFAVPLPVGGFGLSEGTLTMQTTLQALHLQGTARLAGEDAAFAGSAAFGEAAPVIDLTMTSVAGPKILGFAGLAARPGQAGLTGKMPFALHVTQGSDGRGRLDLRADFSAAAVAVPALSWRKVAGPAGTLAVQAELNGEQMARVTAFDATAPGFSVHAVADARVAGRLDFSDFSVGRTQAVGFLTAPAAGQAWAADFSGPSLDISGIVNPPPSAQAAAPARPAAPPSGPLWTANLRFANLILANKAAPGLKNLVFAGRGQGGTLLQASAVAWGGAPVRLLVTPETGAQDPQAVDVSTDDGGFLLRALGRFDNVDGGTLLLAATARDDGTDGVVRLTTFRLMHAPGFAKVLQAISIYGAGAAASGPGVAFDQLVAPFGLVGQTLTLKGARAFSSSLGFTASGTVNVETGQAKLSTTIIPAYAINALPGKIPVVGKLFSPEQGGGLFAVRARISGKLDDPKVSVNPLSALTPGALRDVFGGGGGT